MKIRKSAKFVKQKLKKKTFFKDKKYHKVRDHCHYAGEYRGTTHSVSDLKYSAPKNIPIVFHNESNYDYCFIIKELAKEFKKQVTCLEESTEKYITFTVPIEKEVIRNHKKKLQKYILHITVY